MLFINTQKILSFKEIIEMGAYKFHRGEQYKENELEIIDNTEEEILDLAREMNERLDGIWKETKEDKILQEKFRKIMLQIPQCKDFTSKIGAKFLKNNKFLLY